MRTKFVIGLVCVFVCGFAFAVSASTAAAQTIDYTNLQFPSSITTAGGQTTPEIYGRIYEAGVTEAAGASPTVTAQIGYGPLSTNPASAPGWTWKAATFNAQVGNDDEYMGTFTLPTHTSTVQYSYTFRFSVNGGTTWTYADLDGNGTNPGLSFSTSMMGTMTVNPGTALPPTSAPVTVSGRVTTKAGRPVRGALVYFTDETGAAKYAVTNTSGYYRVAGLTAGASYIATVRSRRYNFDPQYISPTENMSAFDLVSR